MMNKTDKLFIGGKLERIARRNSFFLIYGITVALLAAIGLLLIVPIRAHADAASGPAITKDKGGEKPPAYAVPSQPTVYLTFDDGPSKLTPKVLDILRSEGVPATFFVLGEQAKAQPELIKRIVEEGHALGNHTYNHVYKQLYSSYEQFLGQVQATEDILNDIVGIRPKLVRAPGGTYTNFDALYFANLKQAGYILFDWNIDSGDALRKNVPMKEIVAKVKKSALQHETIVLMHDGGGHEETVKALPEIIHYFKNKGYAFASITPEVKPVQFSLAKYLKWNRGTSSSDVTKNAEGKKTHVVPQEPAAVAKEKSKPPVQPAPNKQGGKLLMAESSGATVPAPRTNPVLTLQIGEDSFSLQHRQYELRDGVLYVPLRALIEGMGGSVVWNETKHSALFRFGGYDGELRLPKRELQLSDGGQPQQTIGSFDYRWKDGSILVPLRQTVELLQHTVETYTTQAGKIEIRVA